MDSDCGLYGRPSEDKTMRLYKRSECDSLGGVYHANGECSRPEGGSFSYDCSKLNKSWKAKAFEWKWWIGGAVVITGGVMLYRRRRKF
jgi:hypothetical protein